MKKIWPILLILCPIVLSQPKQPHIITILIDDLGWNDVGFHGSDQVKTPNIDALAYSGMILNRHYVLPSCTPSRSALLTGLYPLRTGLQGYPLKAGENRHLPIQFKIQPEYLKELGYRTHMVGKWHLGYRAIENLPNKRGFDSFFGYYNGYIDYYKFGYNQTVIGEKIEYFYGYDLHLNDEAYWIDKETYATRLFTHQAEEIIKDHDASQPLYLYFSHLATHTGADEIGMEIPRDADVNKTYDHVQHYERRAFAGCLEELDKSVGAVMQALKEKDMLKNSIILVMSDNGAHSVSIDMPPNWSSNWPLSGTKFTMFEGGIRGAALIWSPLLPKGVLNEEFIHISDWLPTLYSAAGGDTRQLSKMDGIDQWVALQNGKSVKREHIIINIDEKIDAEGIIIEDRWKLIKGGYPGYGYYDYHWGKEENAKPNPEYNFDDVLSSPASKAIESLPEYKNVLNRINALKLRSESAVKCKSPENKIPVQNGFVRPSDRFRCEKFCLFDVIDDPCELNVIVNDEIVQMGKAILAKHKKHMIFQSVASVDPDSNPLNFGGVWMPWDHKKRADSFAQSLASPLFYLFLFIAFTWYLVRGL